jgi:hypothetical protein
LLGKFLKPPNLKRIGGFFYGKEVEIMETIIMATAIGVHWFLTQRMLEPVMQKEES